MAENKSFWIKYLENNPVKIHTLYFNDQERKRPLKNVGHLISAYFPEMQPNERANYSLFIANSEGNTLEALRSGKPLADLPLITYDNPLIIKSRKDDVEMLVGDEYYGSLSFLTAVSIIAEEIRKAPLTTQDSMELIDTNGILKFDISGINGKPDLLYSEEIYLTESKLKWKLPVDTLLKRNFETMVLIGVSGCGKTRTCFDYCRKKIGLYFDCTRDGDFLNLCSVLEQLFT